MIRQTMHFLARTACAVALALLVNLACSSYSTLLAATNGEGATGENTGAGRAERELTETEDRWLEANIHGDAKVTAQLLAEDYQGMTQSGAVEDKAQFVAEVKAGSLRADSFYQDERSVRIFGETAVSTGRLSLKGQDGITQTRYTRVYLKRQGRWQLIIMQTTRITR